MWVPLDEDKNINTTTVAEDDVELLAALDRNFCFVLAEWQLQ